MRIAIVTAVWARPEVTSVFLQGAARLRTFFHVEAGFSSQVYVAGSESKHYVDCEARHMRWVEVENQPLGAKWNAVAETAYREGADYILILGSDDFINNPLAKRYAELMKSGTPYAGCRAFYFYDVPTKRCCRAGGASSQWQGQPIGAGKLMHRSLAEPFGFRPWPDERNKALDAGMTAKMHPPEAVLLTVNEERVGLDVKSGENIWPYDRLSVRNPVEVVDEPDRILGGLPEGKLIRELRPRHLTLVRSHTIVGDEETPEAEEPASIGCFGRPPGLGRGQPDGDLPPAA